MRYRTAISVVVVAGALAACGLSTPPAVGSFSSNTTFRAPTVAPTVPSMSPRADSSPATWEIPLAMNVKDALVKDLPSPDFYFIASAGPGYYLVPKNQCAISFYLSSGHAILDTQPRINVCVES